MAELDDLTGLLGGLMGGENADIDPELLLRLLDIVSKLGEEDKYTGLLRALRPLLREENRVKLDRAERLMKLMSLLPLLRGLGI
ncbi:MAG: hypothetical protein J6N15_06055 [Ruminiclostridium sp.]|nr:hypothetical protein [Ruminiclostridium sp.]